MQLLRTLATTTTTLALIGLITTTPVRAQESWEWEPDEGYHEEEWYDPSDWFDDDSSIDYESGWGDNNSYSDDGYYDWGYDFQNYDPYSYAGYDYDYGDYDYGDDDYYGDYDYDDYYDDDDGYAFDSYDSNTRNDFGLDDQTEWVWSSSQDRWMRASQQRNQQQRGQQQRNQQQRGQQQRNQQQRGQQQQSRQQSGRQQQSSQMQQRSTATIRGVVDSFSKVNLKGQRDQHVVARLKMQDGNVRFVNFGANADLDNLGIDAGQRLMVRGKKGNIAGKSVLMATHVKAMTDLQNRNRNQSGENSRNHNRSSNNSGQRSSSGNQSGMAVRGQVEDWRKMQLGTGDRKDHLFLKVKLQNGKSCVVNLGPNVEMSDLDFDEGDRLMVRGNQRRLNGREILFARAVRVEKEPVQLDWSPSGSKSSKSNKTSKSRESSPSSKSSKASESSPSSERSKASESSPSNLGG